MQYSKRIFILATSLLMLTIAATAIGDWKNIDYGNASIFKYWSPQIIGEGDSSLNENQIFPWEWNKVIIIQPIGLGNGSDYYIGYTNYRNHSQYLNEPINMSRVGMMLGRETCGFWVATNSAPVTLANIGHPQYTSKKNPKIKLSLI